MTASHEVELKLEVEPGSRAAIKAMPELSGIRPRTRKQKSVYFDTADQDLRGAGLSLRIRHVGGKRLQTMKAESVATAGLFVRREWEREVDGDLPQLDGAGDGPAELLAGKPLDRLHATFTAQMSRTIWDATFGAARIELVLDEGRVTLGDRADAVCELELELKQGGAAELFAFARALAERMPARIGVLAKSERGYRLLDGRQDRAAKAEPVALSRDMTAGEAFQAIARSCLRQYRLNETLLLATRGAQPLHQARVALRRLRSALSLFKPMLQDDERYDRFRTELRALAGRLGEARNLDVLIERAGGTPLAERLRSAREIAYDEVCAALSATPARNLLLAIAEWIAIGAWLAAEETAPLREESADRFAAKLLDRYRKRLKRSGKRLAKIDDEGRHAVRILAKKLRYAAEFFSGFHTAKSSVRRRRRFLAALETLQSTLGDLNDAATGRDVLRRLGLDDPASIALLDGGTDRPTLLNDAGEGFAELMDTKRFWR